MELSLFDIRASSQLERKLQTRNRQNVVGDENSEIFSAKGDLRWNVSKASFGKIKNSTFLCLDETFDVLENKIFAQGKRRLVWKLKGISLKDNVVQKSYASELNGEPADSFDTQKGQTCHE